MNICLESRIYRITFNSEPVQNWFFVFQLVSAVIPSSGLTGNPYLYSEFFVGLAYLPFFKNSQE